MTTCGLHQRVAHKAAVTAVALLLPAASVLALAPAQRDTVPAAAAAAAPRSEGNDQVERDKWWQGRHAGVSAKKYIAAQKQAARIRSQSLAVNAAALPFRSVGPKPLSAPATGVSWAYGGSLPLSGRVNVITPDPVRGDTVYIGSDFGGVYQTTNGGLNWTPIFENAPLGASPKIGAIAVDPNDSNTIYVGTGDAFDNRSVSYATGLYRTTDAGGHWALVGGTRFVGCNIIGIAVRRGDGNDIAVATNGPYLKSSCGGSFAPGVHHTVNGGSNWANTFTNAQMSSLVAAPNASGVLYAAAFNYGAIKSYDFGASWYRVGGGLPSSETSATAFGRIALSATAAASGAGGQAVYAAVALYTGGLKGNYVSYDSGTSWKPLSYVAATNDNYRMPYCGAQSRDANGYAIAGTGQCNYDLAIAGDPRANAKFASAGSLLHGYQSEYPYLIGWYFPGYGNCPLSVSASSTTDCLHVDIHAVTYDASGRLWVGSDGGVWHSAAVSPSFTTRPLFYNVNHNLANLELYPGAAGTLAGPLLSGAQDNSTVMRGTDGVFRMTGGGDGGGNAALANGVSLVSANSLAFVTKVINGSTCTQNERPPSSLGAAFVSVLTGSPASSTVAYSATSAVYRTTNAATTGCGGTSWTALSQDFGSRVLTVSAAYDGQTVYASTQNGGLYATSTSAPSTWAGRFSGLPANSSHPVTDIAVFSGNASIAYATVAGTGTAHVYKTTNAGVSWASISGDLPDSPANAILLDTRTSPSAIYVGTDNGVFWTTDGGQIWNNTSTNLPPAPVTDLLLDPTANQVIAATYGRGFYSAPPVSATSTSTGPANDDLLNAASLTTLPASPATVNTSQAGEQNGEPLDPSCSDFMGKTVWYRYAPTTDTSVTADTLGSTFDTVLVAYKGTSLADLVAVACDDDSGDATTRTSKLAPLVARAGSTYWFQVGGYRQLMTNTAFSGTAAFHLTPGGPTNDFFRDAPLVPTTTWTAPAVVTTDATVETNENVDQSCSEFMGKTVWYRITPTQTFTLAIDTAGSTFDTVLRVMEGTTLAGLVEVACNDDGISAGGASRIESATLLSGHTYYIQAGGWTQTAGGAAASGTLNLHVAPSGPGNDAFASAVLLSVPATTGPVSTLNATTETSEPVSPSCAGGGAIGKTLWYRITPGGSTTVTLDTFGSAHLDATTMDTVLVLYQGAALNALTPIGCSDDAGAAGSTSRISSVALTGGQTYYVQVGGFANNATTAADAGNVTVHLTAG